MYCEFLFQNKCAFLFIIIFCFSYIEPIHAENKHPIAVKVKTVHFQEYAQRVHTSGILSYKSQQTLSFKTAGPVERILVEAGEKINKGQLLASLAPDEINAQVDEARARVSLANKNLQRFQQLHSNNALSLEKLQSSETELAVAQSKLRIAQFNKTYSNIHASANGLVLQRHVEPNEQVSPYQPVLIVADESKGWVIRAGVTDQNIVRLALGDNAMVNFDALPGQPFTALITQMTPLATGATGTFNIEFEIKSSQPQIKHQLRSGFIGKIEIQPAQANPVALIPLTAIVQSVLNNRQPTADVLIVNPEQQTAELRTVSIDFLEGEVAAITSGLNPGDQLITTGAGLLKEGDTVKVIPWVTTP
ncbi:efflux RND transporter periplasmic adaptor subunit [Endozoicomonas sp.]|uniref:efflux RND transporter periplasmic adaptor subunit n=1 Tax=Endozoicomonas sp. TaxID=1892382 RepID=UPI00288691AE|nr:efflux RND transporter periplasmic adaptor subunit [Endozoicomonas sp.]